MITSYSKFMRGVDVFDQKVGNYSYPHRSNKWWKCIFYWSLETALVNSYVLIKMNCERIGQQY